MTTDVKKPLPQSIDDINRMGWVTHVWIANNEQLEILREDFFTRLYLFSKVFNNLSNVKYFCSDKTVQCSPYSPLAACWIIALLGDVNSKITFFIAQREIVVLKYLFVEPPYKMPYAYNSMLLGVSTTKNNFIFGITEEVIRDLNTGGIMQHFVKYIEEFIFRPRKHPEPYEPEVFSVERLEFGFVIWLVTCAVAIFAFLAELIIFNVSNLIGLRALLRHITNMRTV